MKVRTLIFINKKITYFYLPNTYPEKLPITRTIKTKI